MEELKKILYFPLASYFRFFAAIRLRAWHPKIIVVTGSSGKTTLLHLMESQIGEEARYSHHANSSFGISFDILDLHRKSLKTSEWISLFLKAPYAAFKKIPQEKLYIVETDCDRPGEGEFLAKLLHPAIVLWLNISKTHSMNFDKLVSQKKFTTVDEAIAFEYGYFLQYCSQAAIINGDIRLEREQKERTKAKVIEIKKSDYLTNYAVTHEKTTYLIKNTNYAFNALLPEEMFYSIAMTRIAVELLQHHFDKTFANFHLPPGRSSLFKGIKNTLLIDSSYNANLSSLRALLAMLDKFPAKKKWVVIGDMLELGELEKEEHEELAEILAKIHLDKVILYGPRTAQYTAKKLEDLVLASDKVKSFQSLREVYSFIQNNITGGEVILFKGSQSMLLEGVIEKLLSDKKDSAQLPRREAIWEERRKKKFL